MLPLSLKTTPAVRGATGVPGRRAYRDGMPPAFVRPAYRRRARRLRRLLRAAAVVAALALVALIAAHLATHLDSVVVLAAREMPSVAVNFYQEDAAWSGETLGASDRTLGKDGDSVAIPNDVTNGGRALKVLESAGLLTVDPAAGSLPTVNDITDNPLNLKSQEVDANLVPSLIPDVTIAVVNGNYALDAGLEADKALYKESEYADNSYYCLIAVRSEDADNPVYQRIAEAYQCDEVIDVYNNQFAGFFTPTWKLPA